MSIKSVHIDQIDPSNPCLFLWAKSSPYKQLLAHMIDTGCCAWQYLSAPSSKNILSFFNQQWEYSTDQTLSFIAYLASLHDIGKAMPQFQQQDQLQYARLLRLGLSDYFDTDHYSPIQHEHLSARIASRIWKQRNIPRILTASYSCVLSLHHQRLEKNHRITPSPSWQKMQNDLETFSRTIFNAPESLPVSRKMDAVCVLLTALIIISDWVAFSPPFASLSEVNKTYLEQCMNLASNTLSRYHLIDVEKAVPVTSFTSLWPHIQAPRPIQHACEHLDFNAPLTIIEAPMGEGKTEAALYLAEQMCFNWQKRGLYVALPTQATSNQMYVRTADMLTHIQAGRTRLLHGTAFLFETDIQIQSNGESDESQEAERWLSSLRMGLLDRNGVGTVDQAMAGVLKLRFSILRLFGLANKVLIIDELHAYDAYMSEIIHSLLLWCNELNIPVILLSATLQNSQRELYLSCYTDLSSSSILSANYPLITQVHANRQITETSTKASMTTNYSFIPIHTGNDSQAVANFACNKIQSGGCICILANTVKSAQSLYRAVLAIKDDETEAYLFHARFTAGKREEIEKQCLSKFGKQIKNTRPHKAILVATQVVEQSLDIDFDGMITELAPIDLLLQRAGRVHRHRGNKRPSELSTPTIYVILPHEQATSDPNTRYGSSGFVYAPFLLRNTETLLIDGIQIHVPADIRTVISSVYEKITPDNIGIWQETAFSQQLMRANADNISFPDPNADLFFAAESHPEFIQMDVDDGYEPAMRATTRLGDPTFRIAFTTPALVKAAKQGYLSKAQTREIFLSSISLSMRHVSSSDLENSSLFKIQKGPLKNCYLSESDDIIIIGKKTLINDPILGILWKE